MSLAQSYSAKQPTIVNFTIVDTNTWEKAFSEVKGVRKWMIKTRESTDNAFDLAFQDTPTHFMTNAGYGWSFDGCDLPDVWVRTATAGTVFELIYWS